MATSKKGTPVPFSWMRWMAFGSLFLFVTAAALAYQLYSQGVNAGYLAPVGAIATSASSSSSNTIDQCLRSEKGQVFGVRLLATIANNAPANYAINNLSPNQFLQSPDPQAMKQYSLGSLNLTILGNAVFTTNTVLHAGTLSYLDNTGQSILACNFAVDHSNIKVGSSDLVPHDNLFYYSTGDPSSSFLNLSARAVLNGSQNGFVHLVVQYAGSPVLDPAVPGSAYGYFSPTIKQIQLQTYIGSYRSVSKANPDACHDVTLTGDQAQPSCMINVTISPESTTHGLASNFLPSSLLLFDINQ